MKTVRLFFGGYGVRRDGNTVGPFTRSDSPDYPFASGRSTFARNGKYVKDGGPLAFDVVAVFDHFPTNEEVLQVRQDLLNDAHPARNRFIGCCAVAAPWALAALVLWLLFGCSQVTEPPPEAPPAECADNPKCAGGLGTDTTATLAKWERN